MEALQQWAGLVAVLIAIGSAIYSWMTAGSKANEKKLDALTSRVDTHAERLHAVEGELRHLPDRDTSHRLEVAIERLNGRIDTLDERLKPVSAISERLQDTLLELAARLK